MRRVFVILVSSLVLAACHAGGNASSVVSYNTTLGQELIDLKKARDSGAIDEEQYTRLKAAVIASRTRKKG